MTNEQDPRLQALFANAPSDLEGEAFVAGVTDKTRFLRYRLPATLGGIALVLIVFMLVLVPPFQALAWGIALGLTTSLFDLGEGWVAWFIAPVNTVGSLLILIAKVIRVGQKKIKGVF
jgi:hypothetical protein